MSGRWAKGVATPREDIVVSVCLSDLPASEAAFESLRKVAQKLDSVYRFREIILVVGAEEREKYLDLVREVRDLRLFVAHSGSGYYERRVVAAEESIGDVVLLCSADEIDYLDVEALIRQAETSASIVVANRAPRRSMRTAISGPLIALGRVAGFEVKLDDLHAIAMPRTLLNYVLGHNEPQLALRFPPRDPRLPLTSHVSLRDAGSRGLLQQLPRRIHLLQKLLIYLAPTLLMLVSISSAILACFGLGFAAYAAAVWVVVDDVSPGWFTTALMLSLSALFMGLSMLGVSLGLQRILAQRERSNGDQVAEEINRVDLFGTIRTKLNVDRDSGPEAVPPDLG